MGIVFGIIREEMPAFALVHKAQSYEVRRYGPSILAECSYGKGGWGQGGDGTPFSALAKYIGVFGKPANSVDGSKGTSIAMTAPVIVQAPKSTAIAMTAPVVVDAASSSKEHTMSFVLPASRFKSVDEAPKPLDPRIRLRQVPERLQAVRSFTWSFNAAAARRNLEMLVSEVEADGWQIIRTEEGDPKWQAAGYNPPFTIPFLKRNEVLVDVAEKS